MNETVKVGSLRCRLNFLHAMYISIQAEVPVVAENSYSRFESHNRFIYVVTT